VKPLILALTLMLTGCQAMMYGTAKDLNELSIGMPKAEVLRIMGTPGSTSADESGEKLMYKRMRATISWAPTWYQVTLKDGKVSAYGEANREPASK
jgi:hypothetical protein